jgi:serine acetyltransferase
MYNLVSGIAHDVHNYMDYLGYSKKKIGLIKLFFSRYPYVISLIRVQGLDGYFLLPVRILAKILLSLIFNIEVASKCVIGRGLILPHARNIVIGASSLGDNCLIMANVTLGAKSPDPGFNEVLRPVVGNNVTIGVGACVLGGIKIEDFSTIGANSVVTKPVASGQTIVGSNRLI